MTQEEADEEARLAEQEDGLQFDLMGAKLDVSSAQVGRFCAGAVRKMQKTDRRFVQ